MLFKSIIFDLDGTLIDSQKSILDSISVALNESNLKPRIFLTKELIGPPLIDLISKIFLDKLIINFKEKILSLYFFYCLFKIFISTE